MLDWQNIDTVLLDMDGTLLDLHFDNYFWQQHLPQRYAEIHGLDHQQASADLKAKFASEYGTLNWYCTQFWAKELQVDIVALKHEISDRIQIFQYVYDFLRALQAQNKHVMLVTNAHRESYDLKMAHIDLRPHFTHVISSHDYGHPKEEQNFWQMLQHKHPFTPDTCLLIDDNQQVLTAAATFGIKHLLTPSQPDSTRAQRNNLQHTSFDCYSQLIPQPA